MKDRQKSLLDLVIHQCRKVNCVITWLKWFGVVCPVQDKYGPAGRGNVDLYAEALTAWSTMRGRIPKTREFEAWKKILNGRESG